MKSFKRNLITKHTKCEIFFKALQGGSEEIPDSDITEQISMINNPDNNDLLSDDENIVIQALESIARILDICQDITVLDENVIKKILLLGNSHIDQIFYYVVDIISWITILDDESIYPYLSIQPLFKQVLLNIIDSTRNTEIIVNALDALCEMINEKFETIKKIDGEDLFRAAINELSKLHKISREKVPSKLRICYPALILLTRCMCFFEANDSLITKSTNEILFFFRSSKFSELKIFVSELVLQISFYQSERALDNFRDYLIQLIDIFTKDETIPIQLIENVLGSLNNMVHKSDDFAVFLPCSPIFDIPYNQYWVEKSEKSLLNYFRLQDNMFLRLITSDRSEGNWQNSIENIRIHTYSIISKGIPLFEFFTFKIKKQFILMICHLIQIDDLTVILNLSPSLDDLIGIFVEYLDCNSIELTFEISKTLLFLIKKPATDVNINVIDILMQNNIIDVIDYLVNEGDFDQNKLESEEIQEIQMITQDLFNIIQEFTQN